MEDIDINPLYFVSFSGFTSQYGFKKTNIKLPIHQGKDLILLVKRYIRGIGSVMGDRNVSSDENKKVLYNNVNHLYGWAMSQLLHYDKNEMWHGHPDLYMKKLEEILNTPGDSDIGYFAEVGLKYADEVKQEKINFPFAPEKKVSLQDMFTKI